MKKTIITALLALVTMAGQGQVNSQKIATDAYGIQAIPYSILFAPDGTILARGLRGEELEKKLAEIFKNK